MSVAAFLDLFQRTRGAAIARREVDAVTSAEERAAFTACGVIVNARDAETMPCRERAGCVREVRDTGDAGPRRFVAVCGQTPPECDPMFVTVDSLARVQVSVAGVAALLRKLFAIVGAPAIPKRVGGEPIVLGAQDRRAFGEGTRDAFLAMDPASDAFAPWLALRDRAARGAVVFVASSRGLAPELLGRYAVGDRVEIVLLEDALVVRGGAIALTARAAGPPLRVVAGGARGADADDAIAKDATREEALAAMTAPRGERRRRKALRKTKALDLPPITVWSELRVCLVDGETVRLDGAGSTRGSRTTTSEWRA